MKDHILEIQSKEPNIFWNISNNLRKLDKTFLSNQYKELHYEIT
jgi:hypothetical protein